MNSVYSLFSKTNKKTLSLCNAKNTPRFTICGIHRAKVVSVYDGDTITAAINLYSNKYYKFSIRLNGIDTPELRTKNAEEKQAGIVARDYLRLLVLDRIIKLDVGKFDKYGRALAYLYNEDVSDADIEQERDSPSNQRPKSINYNMITTNHAVAYDGGTKKKFTPHSGKLSVL